MYRPLLRLVPEWDGFVGLMTESWLLEALAPLAISIVATRVISGLMAKLKLKSSHDRKRPPTVPYWIPFFGSLFPFWLDSEGFIARAVRQFGHSTPFQIRLGPIKLLVISSIHDTTTVLRASKKMTTTPLAVYALENLLGTPKHILPFYAADDSGTDSQPRPGSRVRPEHRMGFLTQRASHRYLTGTSLTEMNVRYLATLQQNLEKRHVTRDWVCLPDLYAFLQQEVFLSAVESLCGPHLISLNPTLAQDFWAFDSAAPYLIKGYPRWLAPRAYAARGRMLANVKRWHAFASQYSDFRTLEDDIHEWEPYWGSRLIKARQKYWDDTGVLDADSKASEDLGILFAQNANSLPAVFWMFYHILADPELFQQVISIVRTENGSMPSEADITMLYEHPLLQSIYAEVLRLRVAIMTPRSPESEDFQLGSWSFPKGQTIGMISRTAALNTSIWNTGSPADSKPLDEFWAERFLVYPGQAESGPLRKMPIIAEDHVGAEHVEQDGRPKFTLKGLNSAWLPYGGGKRMCPGRHFAKQEILGTWILLCNMYDMEFVSKSGPATKPDMRFYLLGGLPPDRKTPIRIRRRM